MNSARRWPGLGSRGTLASACLAGLLVACSSAESDWKKADGQGSVPAYQAFIQQHPNDSHAVQARARVVALEDEQGWAAAHDGNTIAGYQQYLEKQTEGVHREEARERVTGLERAAAWQVAQTDGSETALQAFVQKYPNGPETGLANTQLAKLKANDSRVELAASPSKSQAERERVRLQARYGKVVNDLTILPATAAEKLNRVVSSPMSAEDARAACVKLKKLRQRCNVIQR